MGSALPINLLVNTTVNYAPVGAQAQNLSDLLILGTSNVIDVVERRRIYTSLSAIAADFGTSAQEYLAAALWFEQTPQPTELQIGRWANAATSAVLRGGTLTAAQQTISNWTSISNGSFSITIDGTAENVTGLSFTTQTTLNGIASVIQTAVDVLKTGVTGVWNSAYSRFEIQSVTTGATSTLSFATPEGTGTDISSQLGWSATSSGSYIANGIAAETALAAVTLFDNNYGQTWYGVTVPSAIDTDHLAIAPYIEASTNDHDYGVTTNEAGVLSSVDTTDIAYKLNALGYKRTKVQYSSSNPYAVVSYQARLYTTNYSGNNTVITMMYKQEPGITAEVLTATQLAACLAKSCNVFVAYNNNTAIVQPGVQSSGLFSDIVAGMDWLVSNINTDVYNLLYTSPTKIPQTDAGNNQILTTIENRLTMAVNDGLLAPGVWTSTGFGALNTGDYMPKGFYVYAPPISSQAPADRAARKSVVFQIAAKLAGAIHTVTNNLVVNM